MHALVLGIMGGLAAAASSLVGRVLLALGIGYVAYTGISIALDGLFDLARNSLNAIPPFALQVLGVMQIDRAMNILAAALAARLVLNGLQSGTMKRMILKS